MTDTLRDQLLGLGFKPAPKPECPEKTDRPQHSARGGKPEDHSRRGRPEARGRDGSDAPPRHGDAVNRPPNVDRRGPQRTHPARPHGSARTSNDAASPRRDAASRPTGGAGADTRRPTRAPQPSRNREDIDLAKAYAIRAQREKDERIAAEQAKQEAARQRREAKARLAVLLKDKALNDPAADIARHFDYGGKIKRIHVTTEQLKALNAGELGVVQLDGRYVLVTASMLAEAESIFAQAVALKVDLSATASDDPYADPAYRVPDDLVW